MIDIAKGNILEADAEALVNTVNCDGFMGKGIALQFKQAYPENFKAYEAACHAGTVVPGRMFIFNNSRPVNPRYVINFPTKRHWRNKSRIADIQSGLKALIVDVRRLGLHSIAVPPLGCGLGGLDWREVRPMIEKAFSELPDVRVLLFEPVGTPDAKALIENKISADAYKAVGERLWPALDFTWKQLEDEDTTVGTERHDDN